MPHDDTIARIIADLSTDGEPKEVISQAIRLANAAEMGWVEMLDLIDRVEKAMAKPPQEAPAGNV